MSGPAAAGTPRLMRSRMRAGIFVFTDNYCFLVAAGLLLSAAGHTANWLRSHKHRAGAPHHTSLG